MISTNLLLLILLDSQILPFQRRLKPPFLLLLPFVGFLLVFLLMASLLLVTPIHAVCRIVSAIVAVI